MAQQTISVEREVMAEPQIVWRVITDLDRAHHILTSIERIERLDGIGYAQGTRWRETRRMFGREETQEMWVEVAEPPNRTVVVSESDGMKYTTEITCSPSWMGTILAFTFTVEAKDAGVGKKLMLATLGKAGIKGAKAALEQDLEDVARYAERSAKR